MAKDINTVTLTGRLVKDAELRQTKSGTSVSTFTIGNTQSRKNANGQWEDESHYFTVVLWGRQAEVLKQYLTKGVMIAVTGRLAQRSYKPQNEEKLRYVIEIISENLRLLPSGASGNRGSGGNSSSFNRPNENPANRSYDAGDSQGSQSAPPSEMPEPAGYPENGPGDDMAGGAMPDDDIPF